MSKPVVHFEIGCADTAKAAEFYGPLFGWATAQMGPALMIQTGAKEGIQGHFTALGHEPPEETVVNSFQGYASRLYCPPAEFESDWKALYIQQAPPDDPRGGLVSPVEGGRWLVSLVGGDEYYPPTDEKGFLAFARSLRSPALYEAIMRAEPLIWLK